MDSSKEEFIPHFLRCGSGDGGPLLERPHFSEGGSCGPRGTVAGAWLSCVD